MFAGASAASSPPFVWRWQWNGTTTPCMWNAHNFLSVLLSVSGPGSKPEQKHLAVFADRDPRSLIRGIHLCTNKIIFTHLQKSNEWNSGGRFQNPLQQTCATSLQNCHMEISRARKSKCLLKKEMKKWFLEFAPGVYQSVLTCGFCFCTLTSIVS